jgi:hypothetical protein
MAYLKGWHHEGLVSNLTKHAIVLHSIALFTRFSSGVSVFLENYRLHILETLSGSVGGLYSNPAVSIGLLA